MAQRYWSGPDSHWPEGHPFDADTGHFTGMDAAGPPSAQRHAQGVSEQRKARAWHRSDVRIRDDVCERLAHSNDVDPSDVTVEVSDGVVTLEGSVPERGMRYVLEDVAARCLGVRDVDNRVRVARDER